MPLKSRFQSLLLAAVICSLALTAMTLSSCSVSRDESLFRADIATAYPGFRLVDSYYFDDHGWALPGEGSASNDAGYAFSLESVEVPGFRVTGRYYTTPAWDENRRSFLERGLFNRKKLSQQQLVELEHLWVKSYHSTPVDGDESAGPVDDALRAKQAYFKGNVYVLYVADNSGTRHYFRLDPKTTHWSEVRDYRDYVL
jgi:hypothetical protein